MHSGRELITVYQAMARAQVSRRTIYNWLHANRIEYVRTAGGPIRIFADSLFRPASTPSHSSLARRVRS